MRCSGLLKVFSPDLVIALKEQVEIEKLSAAFTDKNMSELSLISIDLVNGLKEYQPDVEWFRVYDYVRNNGKHWGYTDPESRVFRSRFNYIVRIDGKTYGCFLNSEKTL
jgi:hypothetical protein